MSVRLGAGGAFFRVRSCETYDSVTRAARARSRCSSPSSSNRSRITNATSTVRSPRTVRSLTDRGPYHDGSRPALSDEGRGLAVKQAQPVLQVRLHGSRDDSALERVGERRRLTDERRAVLAAPLPRTDRWLVLSAGGPSCAPRSCGRSSWQPRSSQPRACPQPLSPEPSALPDTCRGCRCPHSPGGPTGWSQPLRVRLERRTGSRPCSRFAC